AGLAGAPHASFGGGKRCPHCGGIAARLATRTCGAKPRAQSVTFRETASHRYSSTTVLELEGGSLGDRWRLDYNHRPMRWTTGPPRRLRPVVFSRVRLCLSLQIPNPDSPT